MARKSLIEARKARALEGLEAKIDQVLIQQAHILELLEGKPKKAGKAEKPADPDQAKPNIEPEKAEPEKIETGEEK